jgi:hypothetical protein
MEMIVDDGRLTVDGAGGWGCRSVVPRGKAEAFATEIVCYSGRVRECFGLTIPHGRPSSIYGSCQTRRCVCRSPIALPVHVVSWRS